MTVTLAFRKGHKQDWLSRLIMYFDKSKYDHVEMIIGTVWIGSHLKTGVEVHKLRKPMKDSWDYVRVTVDDNLNHKAVEFINSLQGTRYDYVGAIFGELLGITMLNQYDDYFCSELICSILQEFDSNEVRGLNPVNVSPQELYDLYKEQ